MVGFGVLVGLGGLGFGGFGGLLAVGCVVFWWVVGCLGLWVCAVWCFLLDVLVSVLLVMRLELVMPVDCLGVLACCGVGIIYVSAGFWGLFGWFEWFGGFGIGGFGIG